LLVREFSYVAVALGVVTVLLVVALLLFRKVWVHESGFRQLCMKVATSTFALAYFLLLLDVGFFAFFTESVGSVRPLTGRRWFCAHWKPLNALGYRDTDVSRMQGRRRIIVVGDSFAAGHGVDDYRDRFSNQLERRLGKEWAVANVAQLGWQTPDEIRALRDFPYDPEIVVLSYCLNDIFWAGGSEALAVGEQYDDTPTWLRPVVERSHLWDYVFLKTKRLRSSAQREERKGALLRPYRDAAIWSQQRGQLTNFVTVARLRGGQPLAVVWPSLTDLELTKPLTAQVAKLLRELGVPTIDLAEQFAGRARRDLIASPSDGHPNRSLHREVADLLMLEVCRLPRRDRTARPSTCGSPDDAAG
jgi:hypothetical protein